MHFSIFEDFGVKIINANAILQFNDETRIEIALRREAKAAAERINFPLSVWWLSRYRNLMFAGGVPIKHQLTDNVLLGLDFMMDRHGYIELGGGG